MQGCTRYRYTKFCIGNRFVEPYFLWKAGASRISIMILWGGVTVLHENAVGCRGHWNVWGALPLTLCLLLYSSNLSFFIRSFFSGSHSEIWRPSNGWKNWWKKSVKWLVGQWIVGVISFQKIFGLCGLRGHKVEIRWDVTFVDGRTTECEDRAILKQNSQKELFKYLLGTTGGFQLQVKPICVTFIFSRLITWMANSESKLDEIVCARICFRAHCGYDPLHRWTWVWPTLTICCVSCLKG